jgi:hypothetical protein
VVARFDPSATPSLSGPNLTEEHLLGVVASGRWNPTAPTGQYW